MIEIKYYYILKDGTITTSYAYFNKVDKAIRFLYKIKNSKNMFYSGEVGCDDPYDLEQINRRFK